MAAQDQWSSIEGGSSGDCPKEVAGMLDCPDCGSAIQLGADPLSSSGNSKGWKWAWSVLQKACLAPC